MLVRKHSDASRSASTAVTVLAPGQILVTLDPGRDDQAALQQVARQRHLERAQWTLARSDAAGTRRLAAVLGIALMDLTQGVAHHARRIEHV